MKRTAVLAGVTALAMSLAVNAADWFSADIGNYTAWPAEETTGTWSGPDGATLTGTAPAATLELDADKPVVFTAKAAKTIGAASVAAADATGVLVESSVQFNAFKAGSEPEDISAAKAGLIVVDNEGSNVYCGIAYIGDETKANTWVELDGVEPDLTQPVAVKITIKDVDGVKYANYQIGDTLLTYDDGETQMTDIPVNVASTVSKVSYGGCGIVAALSATFSAPQYKFKASAPNNATVASVMNGSTELEADAEGWYSVDKGATVDITYNANAGYLFADGTATKDQKGVSISENGATIDPEEGSDAQEATAEIRTTESETTLYLTLNAATKAARDGDTVKLVCKADEISQEAFASAQDVGTHAFTIDLNGKTFKSNSGLSQFYKGMSVTIKNGTICRDAEGEAATAWLLRSYATKLILEDVTINATGITSTPPGEAEEERQQYTGVVTATNGDLEFKGNSTIINIASDVNAVIMGNYASATNYEMGELKFDTTGTIAGRIMLAGGTLNIANDDFITTGTRFLVGADAQSFFKLADITDQGFAALAGSVPTAGTGTAYKMKYTGELFFSLADAVAAVADAGYEYEDDVVTLLSNVTLAARIEPTVDITIDLNDKTITPTAACGNGSAFDVKSGTVTIKNGAIDGSAITATECDAITVRAGAEAVLEDLAVTINSKNGACAYAFSPNSKITIKSGTYINNTTELNEWNHGKTGLKALTLNQANVAEQLIFVEGGSFKGWDPADGDDASLEGSAATFLATGYYSWKQSDGSWLVQDVAPAAKIGTQFYLTFNDAVNAAKSADDVITILADCEGSEEASFDGLQIVISEGKTFTANIATITKNLTISGAGNLATKGQANIAVSATLDLSAFDYHQTSGCGKFDIGATGIVKYPYNIAAAPWAAHVQASINSAADGAQVYTDCDNGTGGNQYTYGNGVWAAGAAQAVAKIGDIGYGTLAAACAAANENDTVVLLTNVITAESFTIKADTVLDLNAKTLTASAGFVNNGTILVYDLATAQALFAVKGTMEAAVDLGTAVDAIYFPEGTIVTVGEDTFDCPGLSPSGNKLATTPWDIIVTDGKTANYIVTEVSHGKKITVDGNLNFGGKLCNWGAQYSETSLTVDGTLTIYTTGAKLEKDAFIRATSIVNGDLITTDDSGFKVVAAQDGIYTKYSLAAMTYKFYANAYTNDVYWTWSGLGSEELADGVQVPIADSGLKTVEGKNYYVSKLVRYDNPNLEWTFTYDSSSKLITKVTGDDTVTVSGNTISYTYTTDHSKCVVDSEGHYRFAEVYLTEIVEAGPQPAAGSETKVEKNAEGEYVVTPTGTSTEVAVDNVNEGDVLVLGATVTAIGVQGGEMSGVVIKVMNSDSANPAQVPNDAMVGWDGNSFSTALDPDKEVEFDDGAVVIPVTPTVGDEVTVGGETVKPFDGSGTVAVKAIPGLRYQLIAGDAPDAIATAASEIQTATERGVKLTNTKFTPAGSKAFYKVQVTK